MGRTRWACPRTSCRDWRISDPVLISSQYRIAAMLEKVATSFTEGALMSGAWLVKSARWAIIEVVEILQWNRLWRRPVPSVRMVVGRHDKGATRRRK